jgi:hypothetical protein
MSKMKSETVTMRVRIGDRELEVTGPSDFVDKKIAEFLDHSKKIPSGSGLSSHTTASSTSVGSGTKLTSAAQFFKKISPKSDVDRALAAAYYLEVIKKVESFTTTEIRDTIRKEAKTNPPKNPSDVVNQNIKKGLMMTAGNKEGKMAYVLTTDGVEAIETLLAG